MARYQFNEEAPPVEWSERGTQLSQFIVRGVGFVLMLVGLWISLAVIAESWSLYKNPANIERLAKCDSLHHACVLRGVCIERIDIGCNTFLVGVNYQL